MVETLIDLSRAIPTETGHALVVLKGPPSFQQLEYTDWYTSDTYLVWVQATQLAAEILDRGTKTIVWVTDLTTGKPIPKAQVVRFSEKVRAQTNSDGLALVPFVRGESSDLNLILVQKGADSVLLPEWNQRWDRGSLWDPTLLWYCLSDRPMYQPGETVHIKGWVRQYTPAPGGDRLKIPALGQQLAFEVYDNFSVQIAAGTTPVNPFGGIDVQFHLPETVHLGDCLVKFTPVARPSETDVDSGYYSFQIQEFRRSEFEVTVQSPTSSVFVGQSPDVRVSAQYFTGGPVRDAQVKTWVRSELSHFTPANWNEFHFGFWNFPQSRAGGPTYVQTESSVNQLDESGQIHLKLDLDSIEPSVPSVITTEARVTDTNRITLAGQSSFLVHPAALTVGVRRKRDRPASSSNLSVDLIVTDLEGNPLPNQEIVLNAFYQDWKPTEITERKLLETPVASESVRSGMQPVRWDFLAQLSGNYRITATVTDGQRRQSLSEIVCWHTGNLRPSSDDFLPEKTQLTLNQSEYQPGETAEILVESSFVPAEGLLTVLKNGIVSVERFTMTGPTHVLKIPIDDQFAPAFAINVDLAGSKPRRTTSGTIATTLPAQPAFASQTIEVPVSLAHHKLSVRVTPANENVTPGSQTAVEIEIKDHAGQPVVSSDCALAVVDEAIWALAEEPLPDPLKRFYPKRYEFVDFNHSRQSVRLLALSNGTETSSGPSVINQDDLYWKLGFPYAEASIARKSKPVEERTHPMPKEFEKYRLHPEFDKPSIENTAQGIESQIQLRTNFTPLAVFVPSVKTDAQGKAKVTFTMPDNVTRYRIIAIAAAGAKQFGTGESTITARLPLMVRPSAPRFLNQGDQFELPVVIQNPSASDVPVEVVVRSNDLVFPNGTGQRVTIPANDRVELRFPAETHRTGTAHVQIAAISDQATDGTEIDIPVYSPVSTESLSTYGELTAGSVRHQIDVPADALVAGGMLELTTASTRLPQLTDALRYLLDYQFTCAEQVSSRLIALAALKPRWQELEKADEALAGKLRQQAEADVKTLVSYQDHEGWFSLWGRETLEPPLPFVSVHATHALIRAKQSGIAVDESALKKALTYLQKIETTFPESYRPEARCTISAYALYVLHLAGNTAGSQVQRILHQYSLEKMPLDAVGWLLPLMAGNVALDNEKNQLLRRINHQAVETSGKVELADSYEDQGFTVFYSKNRTPGIVLEGLLAADPTNPLISKLVLSLIERRSNGRWQNTLENALNLMVLQRYFSIRETTIPNFLARVWLGDTFAGEHHFAGRTTEQYQVSIPLNQVGSPGETKPVILSNEGVGQLYYRLGLNYVPKEVMLSPVEAGFTVARQYEAVDDPDDVKRLSANEWQIRAGARVKVTVTLAVSSRRHHVALVCPIPAGLEILNPALRTAPEDPDQRGRAVDWPTSWLNHQNLRSTRAEAFGSQLTEGLHTYSFFAFATTPGKFLVPPAKAEEMYAPETFGRGTTELVVIHD